MNKRTAELSAGLVAVKGYAAPSNDMPGRVVEAGGSSETLTPQLMTSS
jgi:hypothetical protein